MKEPFGVTLGKTADDCANSHWRNVLQHLYQSLGSGNSGIEGCIREILIHHPQMSCTPKVMVGSSARTTCISLTSLILNAFDSFNFKFHLILIKCQ